MTMLVAVLPASLRVPLPALSASCEGAVRCNTETCHTRSHLTPHEHAGQSAHCSSGLRGSSHAPGRGLLAEKGLPVKDAARIAHCGLPPARLPDRDRTAAMGIPLPPNFFCIPFSALQETHTSISAWQLHPSH